MIRCFLTRLCALWLLATAGLFSRSFAAEEIPIPPGQVNPAVSPRDVKQLFVPANGPSEWPKGDWEVIGLPEYLKLRQGLMSPPALPAEAMIQKARYRAVFTGASLTNGELELQIQQMGGQQLLPLDPLNLAMSSLWWRRSEEKEPAAWGNTRAGRTLLVLPQAGRERLQDRQELWELRGEWTANGRQLLERVDFDLKFAPSPVTELELLLPTGWTLQSSAGQVEGPLAILKGSFSLGTIPPNATDFRLWRVHLGSETECDLSLSQGKTEKPAKPLLLAESDTTYLVRERELQIESRYELEAAFAPVSQVVLNVPRSIRVYAVSYGGDANVAWRVKSQANRQQVVIDFPDPLLGKSRPIRIQGLAPVQSGRAWQLPRVTCPEASLLRGELHLTVESPLELRSYDLSGFRQTAISVQPDQRETLTFTQIAADASALLTAFIGTPDFAASAQVVSWLTTGTEEWQIRTELTWVARSGSRYEASCEVLPGWEILDVRRASESQTPVIADWRLSNKPGRPKLTIEFLEALTPMQSKRVQILARRLPLTAEQSMSLACVKPLGARSVEEFLAVRSHKGDILIENRSSESLTWKSRTYPAFVQNSTLFPLVSAPASGKDIQTFLSKDLDTGASLGLRRSAAPYNASLDVLVHFTKQHIEEKLAFTIEPLDAPVDRITILADGLGEGWDWEFQSEESPAATITPPISTPNETGPLDANPGRWELRPPVPQLNRFRIVAKRQVEVRPIYEVGLPYLPAARDFQGLVEVAAPVGAVWDVQTRFAEEQAIPESSKLSPAEKLRRWHYRSPDSTFTVTERSQNSAPPPLLGRLSLWSLMNGYGGSNIHRAQYRLESTSEQIGFPFQLPENVRLIEVRLNGEIVSPSRSSEGYFFHFLPPGRKNVVEVCYQTTWNAGGISSTLDTPLPGTDVTLLGFDWRFALSPNFKVAESPSGLARQTPPHARHWTTRFFGPLGQGAAANFFRPWNAEAWKSFPSAASANDSDDNPSFGQEEEFFPQGWTIHQAQAPRASGHVRLAVWNQDLAFRWAWVAILISSSIGFALRLMANSLRRFLGSAWILISFAGAGLLPMPWALACGGCLAGMVIALLFPRRFLFQSRQTKDDHSLGSTASFQHHPVASGLLLVSLGLLSAEWAGNGVPQPVYGQPPAASPEASPAHAEPRTPDYNVMIPVDDPRNPRTTEEVVYVDRGFLKQLRMAQPKPPAEDSYLISSAKYQAVIDAQGSVDIIADLEVILLDPRLPAQIFLPIENAYLGGPGQCLVDGVPHPVLSEPEFPGYVLNLSPAFQPAVAERAGDNFGTFPAISKRRVRLQLHGAASALTGGGRFQFSVPAVSDSQFQASLPEVYPSVQLLGSNGQILIASSGKSLQGNAGASRKLELVWSQKPNEPPQPMNRQPSVFALAMIHPFWIEWQIRVKDHPRTGSPSTWLSLPENTLVKAVKSDRLETYWSRSENGRTRLFLEFPEPRSAEFSVDIQCMTPRRASRVSSAGEVRLPALELFEGSPDFQAVEAEYQLGVSSTPELAIGPPEAALQANNDFSALPPDKFVSGYKQAASETLSIRVPQLAWKVAEPSELKLPIQARVPTKRAWLNQEGIVAEREIRWSITAKIETRGAEAFRHVLQVPEAFQIDSVSVFEDETERLVRSTKTGTRLELVLSDGTTGIQNVNISGWLPFAGREGSRTNLPLIQVEGAEVIDSRLRVFQAQSLNHHVQVLDMGDQPLLDNHAGEALTNSVQFLAGARLTDQAHVPAIVMGGTIQKYHLESVAVIERENALQTRVSTLLRLLASKQPQQGLHLRLPPAMTREFRVESLDRPSLIIPYETLMNPDQSLDLVFPSTSQTRLGLLRIETLMDSAEAVDREQFHIQAIGGQVDQSVLLIAPQLAVQSRDEADLPQPIPVNEIPEWFRESAANAELPPGTQSCLETSPAWGLIPASNQAAGTPRECVVRTTLWLTDEEMVSGKTVLELPRRGLQTLSWHWPTGTVLKGILLEGRELSAVIDDENQTLQLLLPSRSEISQPSEIPTLEVHWVQKLASRLPRFGRLELSLPKPREIAIQEASLEIIPAANARWIPQQGISPAEASETRTSENSITGLLPVESSEWSVSAWTMDSRSENVLLICLLMLIFGGVAHWALRRNSGAWLHEHHAAALGLLGFVWWMCFLGSAVGFLIFVAAPLLALARKFRSANSDSVQEAAS